VHIYFRSSSSVVSILVSLQMLRNKAKGIYATSETYIFTWKSKAAGESFFRLRRLMPNQPGDLIWIRIYTKTGALF
jgi:hypothetical protein